MSAYSTPDHVEFMEEADRIIKGGIAEVTQDILNICDALEPVIGPDHQEFIPTVFGELQKCIADYIASMNGVNDPIAHKMVMTFIYHISCIQAMAVMECMAQGDFTRIIPVIRTITKRAGGMIEEMYEEQVARHKQEVINDLMKGHCDDKKH